VVAIDRDLSQREAVLKEFVSSSLNNIVFFTLGLTILAIILAGYFYITAAGEPQKIEFAKNLLIGAGLMIVLALSYFTFFNLLTSFF
jgi:hypothetical protein